MNLEKYLSNGVDNILKGILKTSVKNPKNNFFMMKYLIHSKQAKNKRQNAEKNGEHIPPFLIASITDKCNLHCKGCYARANHSCTDTCSSSITDNTLLTSNDWQSVFSQAEELGIEFILLAGGEPFVRQDVLLQAGKHPHIIFPVFTNGTMINKSNLDILDQYRNILPVISIEGNETTTDNRRGKGIYQKLQETMNVLQKKSILFGASVTVTKENLNEVLSDEFTKSLKNSGTKAIIYVEYVPIDKTSESLALDDIMREQMMTKLNKLRSNEDEMIFIAFPGDEKSSDGCLAAGRGFFHINAHGGAEPCPFSPYSDTNILKTTLKEALHSPLFLGLQKNNTLTKKHIGGCVLFEQQEQVEALLKRVSS